MVLLQLLVLGLRLEFDNKNVRWFNQLTFYSNDSIRILQIMYLVN